MTIALASNLFRDYDPSQCRKVPNKASRKRLMQEELRPSRGIKSTSSWDSEQFEQRITTQTEWRRNETKKQQPKRLQDIGLPAGSAHKETSNDNWPYDQASPCRMFGRTVTAKPGESSFETDFANNSESSAFSDGDSFCGDTTDEEYENNAETVRVQLQSPLHPNANKGASHTSMLAWNRDDEDEEDEDDAPVEAAPRRRKPVPRNKSETSDTSSKSNKSSSSRRSRTGGMGASIRSKGQSALGMIKQSSQRALSTIAGSKKVGEDELATQSSHARTSRRKPQRSRSSDLSATVHGSRSSMMTSARASRRSQRNLRGKTEDTVEPMPGPSRSSKVQDELGATTLHGKSSISRIRTSSTVSECRSTATTSRRAKSTTDRRSMMKRAMSTQNVKRPEEYNSRALGNALPRKPVRREARRNIVELLDQNKPVKEKDLADRYNKQTLHFLMMETKLGVDLGELSEKVHQETKDGVVPPPPKPLLYVEP